MSGRRLQGMVLASVVMLGLVACSDTSKRVELPTTSARAPLFVSRKAAPHRVLRTPAQALRFVEAVARGGEVQAWKLSAGASGVAGRVWSERAAIEDLGGRIRREGGEWGCELAAASYRVGHVGVFSVGDRRALADEARTSGAKQEQIDAFYADMLKMWMADIRNVTTAVCPYPYFG